MSEFIQQLVNGISLGSIYALIALGYAMVYGILKFINFAHGEVFMLGAYSGYFLSSIFGLQGNTIAGFFLVLVTTMIITSIIGVTIEKAAYKPLRKSPKLNVLITAIGVSLFLQYLGQLVFGASPRSYPSLIEDVKFNFGGVSVGSNQLIVVVS